MLDGLVSKHEQFIKGLHFEISLTLLAAGLDAVIPDGDYAEAVNEHLEKLGLEFRVDYTTVSRLQPGDTCYLTPLIKEIQDRRPRFEIGNSLPLNALLKHNGMLKESK